MGCGKGGLLKFSLGTELTTRKQNSRKGLQAIQDGRGLDEAMGTWPSTSVSSAITASPLRVPGTALCVLTQGQCGGGMSSFPFSYWKAQGYAPNIKQCQ